MTITVSLGAWDLEGGQHLVLSAILFYFILVADVFANQEKLPTLSRTAVEFTKNHSDETSSRSSKSVSPEVPVENMAIDDNSMKNNPMCSKNAENVQRISEIIMDIIKIL